MAQAHEAMQYHIDQLRGTLARSEPPASRSHYQRGYADALVGMEHLVKQLADQEKQRAQDERLTVFIIPPVIAQLRSAAGVTDVESLHLVDAGRLGEPTLVIRRTAWGDRPEARIRRAVRAMLGNMRKEVESLRAQAIKNFDLGFSALGDVLTWLDRQDDAHAEAPAVPVAPAPEAPATPDEYTFDVTSADAAVWAAAWLHAARGVQREGAAALLDEGWRLSWFANAMMAAWDAKHKPLVPNVASNTPGGAVDAEIERDELRRRWRRCAERSDRQLTALEAWNAYMGNRFSEGPESSVLHPQVAAIWRQVREALASDKLTGPAGGASALASTEPTR